MTAPARFPTRHGPQPLGKRKMSVSVMETQVQWRGVGAEGRDPLRKLRSHLLFPRLSLYLTLPVQLRPFLGKQNIVTVMFTSTTLRPVRPSTRFMTLRRTASEICGIALPYSTAIESSTASSSSPTSTETSRVCPPLVTLSKKAPTARAVPPPICIPSTSWAAMPAILETTLSLMIAPPRSLRRDEPLRPCGLCCSSWRALISSKLLLRLPPSIAYSIFGLITGYLLSFSTPPLSPLPRP